MADEEALSSLRSRISKAPTGRTRSSSKPLDDTPDTFMGASVVAKSETDDSENAAAAIAGNEPSEEAGRRPRRPRRRVAKAPTDDVDLSKVSQMVSGMIDEEVEPPHEPKLPPVPPAPPAELSEADSLRKQLAETRSEMERLIKKHSEVDETLDDYNHMCEKLCPDQKSTPRTLAEYIMKLIEKEEELDELQETHKKTVNQLEEEKKLKGAPNENETKMNEEINQLKKSISDKQQELSDFQSQLEAAKGELERQKEIIALQGSKDTTTPSNDEEVTKLKELLKEKDSEIDSLKARVSMPSKLPENVKVPEELKDVDLDNPDAVIDALTKQFEKYDLYYKKQNEEMVKLLEEMGTSLEEVMKELDVPKETQIKDAEMIGDSGTKISEIAPIEEEEDEERPLVTSGTDNVPQPKQ